MKPLKPISTSELAARWALVVASCLIVSAIAKAAGIPLLWSVVPGTMLGYGIMAIGRHR